MSAENAKSQARQRLTEIGVDRELDLTEQAAVSRQNIPKHLRRPCYAYIDEFQDFAANPGSVKSLAQILSECRKFGLHLTLAHQNLSQVSGRMLGALGNIQTRVILGISRQDAEWFARDLGSADTNAIKHESDRVGQHPVFAPLAEQWETWVALLKHLPSRQAIVAGYDGIAQRIWTARIPPYTVNIDHVEEIRLSSLMHSGILIEKIESVEHEIPNKSTEQNTEPSFYDEEMLHTA